MNEIEELKKDLNEVEKNITVLLSNLAEKHDVQLDVDILEFQRLGRANGYCARIKAIIKTIDERPSRIQGI